MAESVGIDLGTSNVRVCVRGKGIVLRTPSVLARKKNTGEIIAYGMKAREMYGKTPASIQVIRPIEGGVVADGDMAATLLSYLFRKIGVISMFSRPNVLVTVPSGVTAVERRAVEDAAFDAGARSVTLLDSSVAAAVGAALPVAGPRGCMIADIGGGTTEASVLSLGGVVSSSVLRKGGDDLDEAIVSKLASDAGILIGASAAERLKLRVGAAGSPDFAGNPRPSPARDRHGTCHKRGHFLRPDRGSDRRGGLRHCHGHQVGARETRRPNWRGTS